MSELRWGFDRGHAVLVPECARVLQVCVEGVDAYWTDPDATGWNVGGDRLWVGPEWSWFWTDLTSYAVPTHRVQDANGSGSWHVRAADQSVCTVDQTTTLRHLHGGSDLSFQLARSFTRVSVGELPYPVDVAYRTASRLELLVPGGDAAASLWTLLQVPPDGTCAVPAPSTVRPRDFFDPAPEGTWEHTDGLLRMHLGGAALFKLGLPATDGVDRFIYHRALSDGRQLAVARQFAVHPDRRYVDVPLTDLHSPGSAIEVFCDGGLLGDFSEVEHHSPAADVDHPVVADEVLTTVSLVAAGDWDGWLADWLAADVSVA